MYLLKKHYKFIFTGFFVAIGGAGAYNIATIALAAQDSTGGDDPNSPIVLLVGLLTIVGAAAGLATYIVRLTNAINKMKFDLHSDNIQTRQDLRADNNRIEASLIKQIHLNEEKIGELRHLIFTNYTNNLNSLELIKKDIEVNYRELSQGLINAARKIADLESFEAKHSGYNPRIRKMEDE